MTDKQLAARIRLLRKLGVHEFECRGDDVRIVLGPPPAAVGRTTVDMEPDEPELTGHPSQYLQEHYRKLQEQSDKRGPRRS